MSLKPYRHSIEWCSAELSLEHAQDHYDNIVKAIEHDHGFFQGGIVQAMSSEDVIPDSPLAHALTRTEPRTAAESTK